eukprot:COSAG01_NODE_33601_length_561_cov_1.919913_1_plen_29_part_10
MLCVCSAGSRTFLTGSRGGDGERAVIALS